MARPPKLLFDLTSLHTPGGVRGIGRYIRELARGLSELPEAELGGIELVGLTSLGWWGEHTIARDLGSIDDPGAAAPPSNNDYYVWAYRQRLSFFLAARQLGVAAVHIPDPHATPLFLRLSGIRKIVTCHDLVPTRFPDHYMSIKDGGPFVGKLIEARRYRSADLVVAVSDATRNDVLSLVGMPKERVVRVHNAVDLDRWSETPELDAAATLRKFGIPEGPFALYVGGSDFRKNVEGMLGGLGHARQRGTTINLVWAGNLEPVHRARVEDEVRRAGLSDAVHLIGFVTDEELGVLYRATVAHLFVSRLEGFGLTVVEAMAAGCPVITTRGGSLAEIGGDAALVVDPDDHAAIGDALVRLAGEPSLRAELIAKGRARAPQFSRLAQARAMAAVYRRFFALEL